MRSNARYGTSTGKATTGIGSFTDSLAYDLRRCPQVNVMLDQLGWIYSFG